MGNEKAGQLVQKELVPSENELYSEYMGFDQDVYSFWHCELYTITVVQNADGDVMALSYETEGGFVEEL